MIDCVAEAFRVAERIREEFLKIVMSPDPRRGLTLLVDTGLCAHVLPELPLLQLEADEHHHHKDVYEHTLTVLEQAIDNATALGVLTVVAAGNEGPNAYLVGDPSTADTALSVPPVSTVSVPTPTVPTFRSCDTCQSEPAPATVTWRALTEGRPSWGCSR